MFRQLAFFVGLSGLAAWAAPETALANVQPCSWCYQRIQECVADGGTVAQCQQEWASCLRICTPDQVSRSLPSAGWRPDLVQDYLIARNEYPGMS